MLALPDLRQPLPATPLPEVSRSDARLIGRAVRGRWPMSEEMRVLTIETMETVISNPHHFDPRVVIQAARVLLDADRINIDDESRAVPTPAVIEGPDGRQRADFSRLTDDELDRFIEGNH